MKTWNDTFDLLTTYFEKFGHVNVKDNEVFMDTNLGNWVALQRSYYHKNKMPNEHIKKLLSLGFDFNPHETIWNTYFKLLENYFYTFKDTNVPKRYTISFNHKSYCLGRWLENQRNAFLHKGNRTISNLHIKMLYDLNPNWCEVSTSSSQVSFNETVISYYVGQVFPNSYKYKKDGIELDIFIPELNVAIEYDGSYWHNKEHDLKKNLWCENHNITLIRVRENGLEELHSSSIDFYLDPNNKKQLENILHILLPTSIFNIDKDNEKIYNLCRFSIAQPWKNKYSLCVDYVKKYGSLNFSSTYVTPSGIKLGSWLHEQRKAFKKDKLSNDKISLLNELGMVWSF